VSVINISKRVEVYKARWYRLWSFFCLFVKRTWQLPRINPLNAELNPICQLLALLVHHFLHVSRIRVKSLTLRLLMSYIYIYIYIYIYAETLGSNPTGECECEYRVLSGRGLWNELITRPEESYRLWCVVVCELETSRMRRPWPALGRSATDKKNSAYCDTGKEILYPRSFSVLQRWSELKGVVRECGRHDFPQKL
jgi:hypothetical protein